MQTDRSLISLADLVRRAQAIVDPQGEDAAVTELVTRHEDADDPLRGQLAGLGARGPPAPPSGARAGGAAGAVWGAPASPRRSSWPKRSCSTSRTASTR